MSITVYDEFISAASVSGTLGDLIDGIIESFANEKIDESKSREFYNIVCDLKIEELEEYGTFSFSVGISMEFKKSLLEEEEATREILKEYLFEWVTGSVKDNLLKKVMYDIIEYKNIGLKLDNDSRIEASYTLGYS